MDLLRRRSAGQLSELFGPKALQSDIMFRTLNCTTACRNALVAMPADQQSWLKAYAKGVNDELRRTYRFTLSHSVIGQRMRLWAPIDSLLVVMSIYYDLSFELPMQRALRAAKARIPPDVLAFLTPVSDSVDAPDPQVIDWLVQANRQSVAQDLDDGLPPIGSNAFTIPAGRTSNRRAMLACDTHLAPSVPNIWHRIGLFMPGHQAFGVAIPGLPALMVGANRHLAWGVTNLPGDTLTLLDGPPKDGSIIFRQENINVRGRQKPVCFTAKKSGEDSVEYHDSGSDWISWKALRTGGVDIGISALWRANSVEDASAIVAKAGGPPLTIHLADDADNTAVVLSGKVARRSGLNARVRFEKFDRPIISANDAQSANGNLAAQGWNHAPAHRAKRLAQLIDQREMWSEREIFAMLHDVEVPYLKVYRNLATQALRAIGDTEAADALDIWNGQFTGDALNADLVLKTRKAIRTRILSGVLGGANGFPWRNSEPALLALLDTQNPGVLGAKPRTNWHQAIAQCAHDACGHRLSATAVAWSEISKNRKARHVLGHSQLRNLFRPLALPQKGTDDCVAVCTPAVISAVRFVASPGHPENALISMPGGQSENPFSRHFKDMHEAWLTEIPLPAAPDTLPKVTLIKVLCTRVWRTYFHRHSDS